jgi:cytochrome b561
MVKAVKTFSQYNNISIFLHWLIAAGIVFMFILGWFMDSVPKDAAKSSTFDLFNMGLYVWELSKEVSPRSFYFNLHKSVGISLFALIILRILWRLTHKPPALLDSMKTWEKKLATGAHHGLYFLMVATPLAGIIMSISSKYGIHWFGIKLVEGIDNKASRELFYEFHEVFGLLILLILFFHIAGAFKHALVDKDGTIRRMWFHK